MGYHSMFKMEKPKMENGIQIHGSEDRIIPVKNVQADVVIPEEVTL